MGPAKRGRRSAAAQQRREARGEYRRLSEWWQRAGCPAPPQHGGSAPTSPYTDRRTRTASTTAATD
eukprot:5931673-Amphidinium_carterae.1